MITTPPTHKGMLALLWQKFTAQFQTEEDCVEGLYEKFDDLMKCHHCGSVEIHRSYGARTALCTQCHQTTRLTAGTFFHGIRSARPWLAAIWLIEHGATIDSTTFQSLVGTSYSTALTTNTKVRRVLAALMPEESLAVPSLQFAPVICKRSRETPMRRHPRAEQEEVNSRLIDSESGSEFSATIEPKPTQLPFASFGQRSFAETNAQDDLASAMLSQAQENAFSALLSDKQRDLCRMLSHEAVHFDNLLLSSGMSPGSLSATLTILELEGLVKRLPGDHYVRVQSRPTALNSMQPMSPLHSPSEQVSKTINTVIEMIRSVFGGVSGKYLQNYLAAHWCQAQRNEAPGWLVKECLRFGRITYAQILAYVTPPLVKLSSVPQR